MEKASGQGSASGFGSWRLRAAVARRRAGAGLVGCAALISAGCGPNVDWEVGRQPDTGVLEQSLVIGRSTAADVKALLGEPAGDGGIMMPALDQAPRKTLSYYYEAGHMSAASGTLQADMKRTVLIVYFKDDLYDGYMWFSSVPEQASE